MSGPDLSPEFWLQLLVFIVVTGAGGAGTMLFFVLRGIRENQVRIWDWAIAEVKALHVEVQDTYARQSKESMDNRRWMRHEIRAMYGEILELTRAIATPEAKLVRDSIKKRLQQGDF